MGLRLPRSIYCRTIRVVIWAMMLLTMATPSIAQYYPVQATTQLVPPYSVFLSDYATAGNERLRVILLQRDMTQPSYQLRLHMIIELNGGVVMRTSSAFRPLPIELSPGIPTVISGGDMAPYVDSRNIEFIGISREDYERTRSLPEGSYQITFVAYDYRRGDVQVSNIATSAYLLTRSEPPLISFPACGSHIPQRTPQQLSFSWMSLNSPSPGSGEVAFELSMFETRPEGRDANDIVLTTQPVFTVVTDAAQYVYGPGDPLLIDGMRYVWRVRAFDKTGRDAFRNNGYSDVCTFTYAGADEAFDIGRVRNLRAEVETERRCLISWDADGYEGFVVSFRKAGVGHEWFTQHVAATQPDVEQPRNETRLFDLEPDTEYDVRVQVRNSGFLGQYSDIVKFRTSPHLVAKCGIETGLLNADISRPLRTATQGMLIYADDIEIQLVDVRPIGDGWYQGSGRISIPYFAGAVFAVVFDRLFIDDKRVAGHGRINFVSQGVAAALEQQAIAVKRKQEEEQQKVNRDMWAGVDFHDRVIRYDRVDIDSIAAAADGEIYIIDEHGQVHVNTDIPAILVNSPGKAIIVEDRNGDQYVVRKDPSSGDTIVTRVEGGGLSPASDVVVTIEDLGVLNKALQQVHQEYRSLLPGIERRLGDAKVEMDRTIAENHRQFNFPQSTSNTTFSTDVMEIEESGDGIPPDTRYKPIEYEYNIAVVMLAISRQNGNSRIAEILAAELLVDNKSLTVFLGEARQSGMAEAEQVAAVVEALKKKVMEVVGTYIYER